MAPEPSESRMKSYFEQNRDQFESLPEVPSPDESLDGEKGPVGENDTNKTIEGLNLIESLNDDLNKTDNKDVRFEDVKEEIRLRIIEEDRMDAERDAKELARETSLKFLDDLNSLRDKLKAKYSTYPNRRNSEEINDLISKSGGDKKPISFADRDMGVQAAILGIERRESERRSNREPLEEVANLNEVLFFTRSIRTVRDGFAVFLLDRKVEEKAGQYDSTSFSALFKGFLEKESWTHLIENPIKFLVDWKQMRIIRLFLSLAIIYLLMEKEVINFNNFMEVKKPTLTEPSEQTRRRKKSNYFSGKRR